MLDDTQVQDTQAGADEFAAPDGGGNGSPAELKDILGPVFGTTFKSNEDALKSVESAKNMTGKVGQLEKTVQELQGKLAATKSPEMEAKINEALTLAKNQQFYAEHPEFNNPEAKALIQKFGGDPSSVIQDDVFKTAFTAIRTAKEQEASKSVLMSNQRLGQVSDKITQARDAQKAGNVAGAAQAATAAVLEAYELK